MPSTKGPTPEELEEQARALQKLIDDAQMLQKEITEHLQKLRRENRVPPQPFRERRKRPR
jgi:hypothetical protein